jgi:uncharacterized protein YdeI (BOF family)
MKTMLVASALIMSVSAAAFAAETPSQAECQSMFNQAAAGSQTIPQANTATYISDVKRADANSDGQLSQQEFVTACQSGLVNTSQVPKRQ